MTKPPAAPRQRLLIGILLVAVTLAIYWPATRFEFTNFDDPAYVTDNPMVQRGLTWPSVKWALTSSHSSLWLPVTRLVHLATWQVFGDNSGGHHLVNIVIHALNALLAFLVVERMTRATVRSAFVAALFAWHPLRVESVAWVAELKDVLAVFFGLLTMWCYLRFVKSGKSTDRLLLIASYALGLMGKPMLVTLPFALFLIDIWPLRRLGFPAWFPGNPGQVPAADSGSGADLPPTITWRRAITEKLPLLLMAIAFCGVTLLTTTKAVAPLPLTYRIANAFLSYARYVGKIFYPVDLAALYPHPGKWPSWQVVLAILFCGLLTAGALSMARKRPYVFSGWFWFVGILVPVIGLVQAGPQAMADRFTYLPSLGLTMLVVWAVAGLSPHLPFGKPGAAVLGGMVTLACLAITHVQLGYWKNSITLFEHTLAVTTNNDIAHYNLGEALNSKGYFKESIPHYEEAIRLNPKSDDAWNNLGVVYARLNQRDKAAEYYRKAMEINPKYVAAHFNYGLIYYFQQRMNDALAEFNETLRLSPDHHQARCWIGRIYAEQGRLDEARQNFLQALELNPRSYDAHYELGVLRMNEGETAAAIQHFQKVIQLKPDYVAVYGKLGLALASSRQPAEAITQYRRALASEPDAVEPLNNLAWLLATDPNPAIRNGTEAVELASRACQVTSNQIPSLIGTLAAAYAEAARFEDASRTARLAADVATRLGQTNIAEKNRELQQLYEQRKPFRQPQ
jgi:tetratricopeptide (TPR) repeat protein